MGVDLQLELFGLFSFFNDVHTLLERKKEGYEAECAREPRA